MNLFLLLSIGCLSMHQENLQSTNKTTSCVISPIEKHNDRFCGKHSKGSK